MLEFQAKKKPTGRWASNVEDAARHLYGIIVPKYPLSRHLDMRERRFFMASPKEKARYFCGLVYPESASEDWQERLKKSMGSYAISPLHEPDNDEKKPHYHVVYYHGHGPATIEAAKRVQPDGVFANGHIEICAHPRTYQRYLIHLDDKEKQQFDEGSEAIKLLNGFPLDLTREFTKAELLEQKRKCFEILESYSIVEYCDMLDYLLKFDFDLFDYASNHTILFNTYLTSKRNKFKDESALGE